MPRPPRLVLPGIPHHITQRGNYRQTTYFRAEDYRLYLQLLKAHLDSLTRPIASPPKPLIKSHLWGRQVAVGTPLTGAEAHPRTRTA